MQRGADIRMVQALRAVSCLLVVIYHAVVLRPGGARSWPNGSAGVDLFFVISGYVMVTSSHRLAGQPDGWRRFLRRRLRRIVPLYWLLTMAKYLVTITRPDLTPGTHANLWSLVASLAFIPVRDGLGHVRPLLPVGWSLNFEMLFYILFAMTLALRLRPLWMSPVLCVLAAAGFWRESSWPAPFFLANGMVLEFVAGMVIAEVESSSFLKKRTKKLLSVSAGTDFCWLNTKPLAMDKSFLVLFFKKELLPSCLLAASFVLLLTLPSHGPWRGLAWGLPAAAILAACISLEPGMGPRLPFWLLAIGDASYAIYLVHPFIVPALARHGTLAAACAVPLSVAAGVLVHRVVDAPLQRRLAGKQTVTGAYAAGAGVLSP